MKFREARLNAGKTVQNVMDELKVTDAAVYLWETGITTPKIDNLKKLASFYGVTIDYLLSDDPDSHSAS